MKNFLRKNKYLLYFVLFLAALTLVLLVLSRGPQAGPFVYQIN